MIKKIKLTIIIGSIIGFITASLGVLVLLIMAYGDLPNIDKLIDNYKPVVPSNVYDINGELIDQMYEENRKTIDITRIPKHTQNAFISIEDKRFRDHYGIDPIRLAKAMFVNIKSGKKAQGGSTITQQLAKNAFLSFDKTMLRKVKEAIITVAIERKFTKDEILEKYLNEIDFSSGAYGIETASQMFFKKAAMELNIAESALLAGVPNRPSTYSPRTKLHNSIKRKNTVLYLMRKWGYINDEQYETAKKQKFIYEDLATDKDKEDPFVTLVHRKKEFKRGVIVPEFSDMVQTRLHQLIDEKVLNIEKRQLLEDGYKIYTTLDMNYQKEAMKAFNGSKVLELYEDLNGGMITFDSQTGHVKAVVGGKNFKAGNFNRVTMASLQPGSAFKPFLYFTAMRNNIPMNVIKEDSKTRFGKWRPKNYGNSFRGNVTLLESIEKSINISAIKLLQTVGYEKLIETTSAAGITSKIPMDLTAALGTMNLTPYELAKGFIPLSNGGYRVKPVYVTKIVDRYGKTIYESKPESEKVFESENVALITHMMQNIVARGSGKKAEVKYKNPNGTIEKIDQAGKTGTTNQSRAIWYIGFTPDTVTVIYLGKDDNKPNSSRVTGGKYVAPIWGEYYSQLIEKGYYTPVKFAQIENNVKDKTLFYRNIDLRTGLLASPLSRNIRQGLFKREHIPVESSARYLNGLDSILGEDKEVEEENLGLKMFKNEENNDDPGDIVVDDANLSNEEKTELIKQNEQNKAIDDILNDVFSN